MRIAILTRHFAPYSSRPAAAPRRGGERECPAAELAAALVGPDLEVHAVAPLDLGIDTESCGLARRLRPLKVMVEGEEQSWIRFDGATGGGVRVHLLMPAPATDGSPAPADAPALDRGFLLAAVEVARSLGPGSTWCCSWNPECAAAAAAGTAGRDPEGRTLRHLLVLTASGEWSASLAAGVQASERVAIIGNGVADRWRAVSPVFGRLGDEGRLAVFPSPVPRLKPLSANHKADAKAALQIRHGLPVRADLPLVAFIAGADSAGLLGRILRNDVLVALLPLGDDLPLPDERYPDRLVVAAFGTSWTDLLAAADIAVISGHPTGALLAMSHGAVPVVGPNDAEGVVDLAPDLSSGSGAVAASAEDLFEACGRALAAFHQRERFAALSRRIAGFSRTWPEVAAGIAGMMSDTVKAPGDSMPAPPSTPA